MRDDLSPTERFTTLAFLFVALELFLILYVDRPLSMYLRTVDAQHPMFIDFFRFWTNLGRAKWYLIPSGIGALIAFSFYFLPTISADLRTRFLHAAKNLGFFFLCISGSGLFTDILKRLIGRARPVLLDRDQYYGFDPISFHNNHLSLPSGHSTTVFAVAFALAALVPRWQPWLVMYAVFLAGSRVMVNAHYLSDIMAGAVVALLSVILFRKIFEWRRWLFPATFGG